MGNKLRLTRKRKLLTQADLAKRSGVSRTTISAIEQNKMRYVSTRTLTKIADALDCTIDQIFFSE